MRTNKSKIIIKIINGILFYLIINNTLNAIHKKAKQWSAILGAHTISLSVINNFMNIHDISFSDCLYFI